MGEIEIEDVQRLNVRPGDVLLVTVPHNVHPDVVQEIKNRFETTLPVRVIVKTAQVQVEVVSEDAAE